MHRLLNQSLTFAVSAVLLISSLIGTAAEKRRNVLFIAVDDLRPELGCYGNTHVHSPNIDKLSGNGFRFERAYCQQAVCNPSRTSLMTGMRPDSIGITGNHAHFRSNHPHVVTLPQHFKNHGYHAAAIGKIYHGVFPDGASITKWDTMGDAESWSVPAIRFGPRYYYTKEGIAAAKSIFEKIYEPTNPGPEDWTKKLVFGPATESPDVPDSRLYDGQVADSAVKTLQQLRDADKPFFLAVGFIKPHSPYIAPKTYFDLYDDVSLPKHTKFPTNAPAFAGHGSEELRRYTDQPRIGAIADDQKRRVRHAYYACISYIDAQIGRVLDELERTNLSGNTIVVLYGDHGYHLGEQGLWGKTTNFELDTRVPLIIRSPGMTAAGQSTSSLVELVDLYPTLSELAGLPISDHLEGTSFAPILDDPTRVTKTAALSQFPRGDGLMGYSMRTSTHRLTQWVHRPTGEIRATELYDYADGLIETQNIADSSPQLVAELTTQLTSAAGLEKFRESAAPSGDTQGVSNAAYVSFEEVKAGRFDKLETTLGTWKQSSGLAIVNGKHAKTGEQCLQLTGGEETSVTLGLAKDADTTGELTFWAERWTKREPFSFRIEKSDGEGWTEIFNGDKEVQVGRAFLSQVKVHLGDENIKQLRLTVTSPESTGVLIDDIRIAPALPQKIVSVEVVPLTLPALVGTDASPLLKLKVKATGSLNPISLTELWGKLQGIVDIESLHLSRGEHGVRHQLAMPSISLSTNWKLAPLKLADGENFFWFGCKLKKNADIDHRVGAALAEVTFSNGETFHLDAAPVSQRIGVAVRNGGDEGINTFRIPGLATSNMGTLIGVYDVRRRSGGDLPGDIDVGMSRSKDGGQTWEPMRVIMDMGDDPMWNYDGIGDPAVLVDKNTGTIWVAATWSHGNRSWRGSGPGLKPEETGQLMLVRSDDDGVTWSNPINITKQVKKSEWCFILQGPGKGITMHDGTIVFAAQYQDPPNEANKTAHRLPHSTIIYSKDHGTTWEVGTGAFDDTTESQVVELEPGMLMLNCRYNRKAVRVVMTTRNMGKTWQKHTTSERSLIEPGSCMASLIDVDQELGKDGDGWLLFSNPDSTRGRHHITIKASPDRGLTWPKENRLLLDEGNGAGYSCMSMIDENTVGILYEGSQAQMSFQRIPLKELVGKNPVNSVGLPASPFTTESTETAFQRHSAASKRPNILLIVSEDNGVHLGCYGEKRVHTPHLDAVAASGVRYTRAYVPYSVCSPSRAAFLTGLYTRQTGHIGLATHRFSMYRDFKTMPAYFQQAGYYTGFLGKTHINPERLVEDFVDHHAIRQSNFGKTISIEEYAREAAAVMRNASEHDKPFLLIINYADAHRKFVWKSKHGFPTQIVEDPVEPFPWIGSDTPAFREELRDYFNCMNRLDEGVGMVFDTLDESGARDNTLIVYISDHGADFPRGKGSVYENGTRIPMIVNYPKDFPTAKIEDGMVSTIDIMPTMLRAADIPVPDHLPGIALQDIDSGAVSSRRYIHTFTTGSSPNLLYMQFGIRDERYKLIYNPDRALNRLAESRYKNSNLPHEQHMQSFLYPPEYELFDLQDDPHEWKNLADSEEHIPARKRLLKAMQDFQREIKDPFADKANIQTFIAEQKEYSNKPYKKAGFRWPHLDMFEKAQERSREN